MRFRRVCFFELRAARNFFVVVLVLTFLLFCLVLVAFVFVFFWFVSSVDYAHGITVTI